MSTNTPRPSPQSPQSPPSRPSRPRGVVVPAVGAGLATLVLALTVLVSPVPATASDDRGVAVVNELRAVAGLPAVPSDAGMRTGAREHSEYMSATSTVAHHQDPDSSHFTVAGDEAARRSNLKASSNVSMTARQAVEGLMTGPFHGIGFVDPRLQRSGGALHSDPDADRWRATYTINVLGARSSSPPSGTSYPIVWPGHGSTVSLTSYGGSETPDPLTSCSGFSAPTGLPILVQFASAESVRSATVRTSGGAEETVCAFDQHTYTNPDGTLQQVGRSALAARDAAVVIPRLPLSRGETYEVEVRTSTRTVAWSFTVGSSNQAGGPPPSGGSSGSSDSLDPGSSDPSDDDTGSPSGPLPGSSDRSGGGSSASDSPSTGSSSGDAAGSGSATSSQDADGPDGAGLQAGGTGENDPGDVRAASEVLREAPLPAEPAGAIDGRTPERRAPWWHRAVAWFGRFWAALSG